MMANFEEYPLFSSQMVTDHRGNTFRSVYTVRFTDRVFVLHAFEKKAKSGIATPKSEFIIRPARGCETRLAATTFGLHHLRSSCSS